jgi:hypothetical protein
MRFAFVVVAALVPARQVEGSCTSIIGIASDGWCTNACKADPTLDECVEACKCNGDSCKGMIDLVALAEKWCDSTCGEGAEDPNSAECVDYCDCSVGGEAGVYLRDRKHMAERPLPLWAVAAVGAGECVSVVGTEADAWCDRMCFDAPETDDCKTACDCSEDNSSGCISTTSISEVASGWCEDKCAANPETVKCKELCRCPAVSAHA